MDNLLVDAVDTRLSESELTYALKEGWKLNFNQQPNIDSLAILWSQVCLETARGSKCKNFNFGNIKKTKDHKYCMFRCNEVINGKIEWFDPPHPQTHFNAYDNSVLGAQEYINFISKRERYKLAWEQLLKGDPVRYCMELKKAGYFTADLVHYTKGVSSLFMEFKKRQEELMSFKPKPIPTEKEPKVEPENKIEEQKKEVPENKPTVVKQTESSFKVFLSFFAELFKRFFG
jgi:hypothetical protein